MRHTVTSELDPDLFDELERERNSGGISRSAAIRQAVEWWIVQRKEHGEERVGRLERQHRQVMRRFDYIAGMIREQERKLGLSVRDQPADKTNGTNGHSAEHEPFANLETTPERGGGGYAEPENPPQESSLARARKRTGRRM